MIQDHLNELRAKLEQADNIPAATKSKLLEHIAAIEEESSLKENSESDGSELMSTVQELEVSHPEIVGVINRIAVTLSNMGI